MFKQSTRQTLSHHHLRQQPPTTVLVLGGHGFIGRYTVKALRQQGARVLIGTRALGRAINPDTERAVVLHQAVNSSSWSKTLENVDVVINTVGILRERRVESFEAVHHLAVGALARACKAQDKPLIHMSALGVDGKARNANTDSKLRGEKAIVASQCAGAIVRTSVVNALDGYGSGWLHRVANWPVWLVPAGATSLLSPIEANDAGEVLATLALGATRLSNSNLQESDGSLRQVQIGCGELFTLQTYLTKLRERSRGRGARPLLTIKVPQTLALLFAHIFDVLHITPYSVGHHELLEHDNFPVNNELTALLGRSPTPIGLPLSKQVGRPALGINDEAIKLPSLYPWS